MNGRSGTVLTLVVCGLAALFLGVVLGPALVGQGTLIDVGTLSGFLPFRAEVGRNIGAAVTCRQDTFDFYMPGVAETKRALLSGRLPTWAPYEVGGSPLGSLPNHGVLSPISLPYLVLPLWLAPAYVLLLQVVVTVAGMVLFLRRLGLAWVSGLLAGLVLASSGFMVMWTNWPHTRVAALIPALFWALERLVQERRPGGVVIVAAVVGSMLLGGFPAIVLFALTLAGPYVLVRVLTLYRAQPRSAVTALLAATGGLALGIGVSAIQVVPFAANIGAFDFAARDESGNHLPLYTAFTLMDPYALGSCLGGERYGPVNPVEGVGFLGGAALVVACGAMVLRRRAPGDVVPTRFFTVSALALGTAIWAGGPVLAVLQMLPLWSTNFVGRAQSVFGFLAAVLVAVGFDRLTRGVPDAVPARRRLLGERTTVRVGVVLAGAGVVAVAVTTAMVSAARGAGHLGHLLSTVPVPVLVLIAGALALAVAARGRSTVKVLALIALAVLVVGQGTAFTHTLLPPSRKQDFYPVTPTHAFLAGHLGHDRYGAGDSTMFPATTDYYRLRTPVGHEFTDSRWKDLLLAVDPDVQRSVTFSTFSSGLTFRGMAESPLLDQLAVRYWVARPSRAVGQLERIPDRAGGQVMLEPGLSASCTVAGGPVRGIRLVVRETMPVTPDGARPMLHVSVTSGGVERQGAILVDSPVPAGPLAVAVAGEDLPRSATAEVRVWLTGADSARIFRGAGSELDCAAVRPAPDGVRLVRSDAGGAVYERLSALPRIRWADRTRVVVDGRERVALLRDGLPTNTVLVEDERLPAGQGLPGQIEVSEDRPERMTVNVDAEGSGYVVVADSIVRPGWRATLDGRRVALERGDHAFAAVPVPAGRHVLELSYRAPGLRVGAAVSAVSLALAVALVVAATFRRRRLRQAARAAGSG